MARETLRDFNGRVYGYIEDRPHGDKAVTDFGGRVLGITGRTGMSRQTSADGYSSEGSITVSCS